MLSEQEVDHQIQIWLHGLHVDTGRFGQHGHLIKREDRICLLCHSRSAEDEHHFLFDCPVYSHIRDRHPAVFQTPSPTVARKLATTEPNLLGGYLRKCYFHTRFILSNPSCDMASIFQRWVQLPRLALIQRTAAAAAVLLDWLKSAPKPDCFV